MADILIVEEEKTMVLKISQMASKFISLSAQYNNKALYLSRKYFIFMTERHKWRTFFFVDKNNIF
mgnify:FL=1